ncbi:MAG: hypothetical protein KC431_27915 [Myxococcales bacterium]|nr:hypothetical protein [Myxococcales bacterium]
MASELRTLALVATAAPLLAGCSVDEERPQLLAAHFSDPGTLVLQFSEPLGPIAGIDPAAHFRLSASFVVEDVAGLVTVYYDVAYHFPFGLPGQGALPPAEPLTPRHGGTLVSSISHGDGEDELRLTLSYPIEDVLCQALSEAAALDIPAAIHLHYDPGAAPRIVDRAGNGLADIAGWWVSDHFAVAEIGAWPELDPRIEIPCPE